MAIEAAIAARHDRALRALGAVEPAGDVYRAMQVAYPGAFLAMLAEGAWRGIDPDAFWTVGASVFVAAKALKYWAIASLGSRWTFRVLVPAGSQRIIRGPYRWMAHPNYLAVALELAGVGAGPARARGGADRRRRFLLSDVAAGPNRGKSACRTMRTSYNPA